MSMVPVLSFFLVVSLFRPDLEICFNLLISILNKLFTAPFILLTSAREMANVPWLSFNRQDQDISITEHKDAYKSGCLDIPNTHERYPSLVAFMGRMAKSRLLRAIFTAQGETIPYDPHGQIRIWSEPLGRRTAQPTIYFDCELHTAKELSAARTYMAGPTCVRTVALSDSVPRSKWQRSLGLRLYSQVLVPLLSTLCLFAEDMTSKVGAVEALAEMAIQSSTTDTPSAARPRIVIVLPVKNSSCTGDALKASFLSQIWQAMQSMKDYPSMNEVQLDFYKAFSELSILEIDYKLSPNDRAIQLQNILAAENAIHRKECQLCWRQYSYKHCQAFLDILLKLFVQCKQDCLSLLKASKCHTQPPFSFERSLYELLLISKNQPSMSKAATALLSSALVLNSCPPQMHCKISQFP